MKIEDTYYTCELEDILDELISQMQVNELPYLQKGYKRSGNSLQVQCPYHAGGQERKPSFGIRRSDGMGHCFACGKIVTLPEFITQCFEKDDILSEFGRRWLRKNFMSLEVEERKDIELDYGRTNHRGNNRSGGTNNNDEYTEGTFRSDISNDERDSRYVSEAELDRYRYYHPYWEERGIIDDDIIELFDLGFDKETNCITFPVRDKDGNCLFVARRNVRTKFFNYPEGVEKPLYGLYELYRVTQHNNYKINITENGHQRGLYNISDIFVCESMIDCILLWQVGHYAVALNGTGNKLQIDQLNKLPCRKLILATDNDAAGYGAQLKIRKALKRKITTYIAFPRHVKDIGEMTEDQLDRINEFERF